MRLAVQGVSLWRWAIHIAQQAGAGMSRVSEGVDPTASLWHLLGAAIRHWREDVAQTTLREVARQTYVDPGDLSKWERGLAHPQTDAIQRIDTTLGAGCQLIALHAVVVELERHRKSTLEATPSTRDEDDMERRALLQLMTMLGTGAVIPTGIVDTLCSGITHAIGKQDTDDPDQWEQTAWEYGQNLWTEQPGEMIADLAADILAIGRLLTRDLPVNARDTLLRVSAQLGVYMAQEFGDTGNQRAAWRSWQAARQAAEASGDRDLYLWVGGYGAQRAFWDGHLLSAISSVMDETIHHSAGVPSLGLAVTLKTRAAYLASEGYAVDAQDSLNEFKRVFERLPSSVTQDRLSVFGLPEEDLWFKQGLVCNLLGDSRTGVMSAERALALNPPEKKGGRANINLVLALGMVREGEISEGLSHAITSTQDLPVSATRRRIARHVLEALPEKAHTLPAARELRTLISA